MSFSWEMVVSSWPTSSSLRKCQRLKSNFLPVLTRRLFRTGYTHMREMHMELFGQDILGRTDKDWGLDQESETSGSYRPCGFPGVGHRYWYTKLLPELNTNNLGFRYKV